MQIRQYKDNDLESVLSSWASATRLAHPFMTDQFIAQARENVIGRRFYSQSGFEFLEEKFHEPVAGELFSECLSSE